MERLCYHPVTRPTPVPSRLSRSRNRLSRVKIHRPSRTPPDGRFASQRYANEIFGSTVSEAARDVLPRWAVNRVLDVGGGSGELASLVPDGTIVADISHAALKSVAPNRGTPVVCDFNDGMPFGDRKFGSLVASHVLEHLESPVHFLREAHRILEHGGVLILSVPNERCLLNLIFPYFDRDGKHLYSFSRAGLGAPLEHTKFELLAWRGAFVTSAVRRLRLGWLDELLRRMPLRTIDRLA